MGLRKTTLRWTYSMLAMNNNVSSTIKSMDKTRSKLAKIGVILLFGILLEIASYVAVTDAAPSDSLPENAFEASKRAGFVGMRGKKSYGFDNQGDLLQYLAMMYQPKPQPELKRAGFVGMRGKKSINDESTLSKRAAFVGMRGRRTPLELGYDDFLYMPYIQDLEDGLAQ